MSQRVALQAIKSAQKSKKFDDYFLHHAAVIMSVVGAVGGVSIGMWQGGVIWRPNTQGERLVDKTVTGVTGGFVGGAAGYFGTVTAPVWMPLLGAAYIIDRFQTKNSKKE